MWKDLITLKERRSIFDTDVRKSLFFDGFMQFQIVYLVSVFYFLVYYQYMGKQNYEIRPDFTFLVAIFVLIYAYFFFKQLLYYVYGQIFSERGEYKLWSANYHTIRYIWEMFLYLPVLWLLFDGRHLFAAVIFFLFIYILFRIAVIYITIRIFYHKKTGFLYLSLYLCAQEIIPLLFLYEGFNYLHNIIQMNTLWH
jgi:hypothetical protein